MSSEIATRQYSLMQDGQRSDITVRLFKPEPGLDGADYQCRFRIEWPSEVQELSAHGVDAVQALILSLKMLGATINTSQAANEGRLVWLEPGAGFGLPVPRNIEDILQGDDQVL